MVFGFVPLFTSYNSPERIKFLFDVGFYTVIFLILHFSNFILFQFKYNTRRFGFANLDAVSAGQTGQDCRGEEHEVTIVWSVHSGKRIVIADGKEVHYSHSRNKTFDFSWTMRGNHVLKVIALAQPMTEKPNIRQYDFLVDGQSYFTFPKVFKLGLTPGSGSGSASRGGGGGYNSGSGGGGGYGGGQQQHNANYTPYVTTPSSGRGGGGGTARRSNGIASIEAPHNPEEEDAYLKQAIENSMLENISPKQNNRPSAMAMALPPSDAFLLDFATPAPVEAQTQAMVPVPPTSGTSSYASDIFGLAGGGVPAQQAPAYAALPPSTTAAYPPVAQAYPSQQQQQQQPSAADPWGMASVQSALPVVAAEPVAAAAVSNPFGDMIAAPNQQPVPEAHNNFPSAIGSPPPVSIDTTSGPTDNVFASGLNTPASTIGFQSPIAQHQQQQQQLQPPAFGDIPEQPQQQYSLDPQQQQQQQEQQTMNPFGGAAVLDPPVAVPEEAEPTPATGDPALLSMNVLSGQPQSLVTDDMKTSNGGTTLADQAYSKLVNMDAFDLVQSKEDTSERKNPFEAMNMPIGGGAIGGGGANNTASLADLMKTKKPTMEKKDIMAPPPPGALVLSNNQTGNFGGYGGMGGGMMQQQQQQPMVGDMGLGRGAPQPPMMQQQYGQQGLGRGAIGFGQQPPPIYGGGMNMMQQPTNGGAGGPPPLQQYGGQPTYGGGMQQQQPPSMQQYGQPPPSMQQQPTYGQQQQPPPLQQQQQQPFGF